MRQSSGATAQVAATRGRPFINGNPGRPPGSRNRTTVLAEALLDGEAEVLLRKALELAMDGDVPMLKFLLDRLLPRDRLIKLDLPDMESADDAVEAHGRIFRGVSEGQISPNEAAALANVVSSSVKAIDTADVVRRLDALELEIKHAPLRR